MGGPIGHDRAHGAQIVGRQPRDLVGVRCHHLSDDAGRHAEPAGDTGLCAKIVTRIFQGNPWLFQCESECGPAIVIRQNDGQTQPAEGDAVRLAWRPEDMSARAGAAA